MQSFFSFARHFQFIPTLIIGIVVGFQMQPQNPCEQDLPQLIEFPYKENTQNLVEVEIHNGDKGYLDQEAAEAFKQMKSAAKQDEIELILISGFRSVAAQKKLFERQTQRQGSKQAQAAARLTASPGFSENHTGYALDIGDGKRPETELKLTFEDTEAYNWLKKNAYKYKFELSFHQNNRQGVSYQPWHWRFIGSKKAEETFRDIKCYQ